MVESRLGHRRWMAAVFGVGLLIALSSPAASTSHAGNGELTIVMVTFRGCEEACEGFIDYIAASDLSAHVTVRDIDRDRLRLPALVEEVNQLEPDLLVTWGTTVTLGMIGTLEDSTDRVTNIPTVFMIVADPVGANIVESYEGSGRPLVTGTRNRVPEEIQMRVLADYRAFDKIGLVYNDDEVNAVLKAREMKRVAVEQGFDITERVIATDAEGVPIVEDIPVAVADMAAQGIDFLYVGSSSFLLENADTFTSAALDHGLAVATAYEAMVRDSDGLIALASPYYNVGQLAGFQAERILADGAIPGDLEIAGLNRFTVLVNIDTAAKLGLYPPMLMLRYAEIVGSNVRS